MVLNEPFGTSTYNSAGVKAMPLRYEVPASETDEGRARLAEYYEGLGHFVQLFAEVEMVAAQTLWRYARTPPEIARVIFAGTRMAQGSKYIKQIITATNEAPETAKDLEYVLSQLSTINEVRDNVLHYGMSGIAEGKGVVSNAWRAKAEPTKFAISRDALDRMTADLRKIIAHLAYRHLGRPWPRSGLAQLLLSRELERTWLYKHVPLSGAQTKGKDRSAKSRRQRQRPHLPEASSK